MNKTISKLFATVAAVSMLATATAVNAEEAATINFTTRSVEAGVIVTGVEGATTEKIEIPEKIGEAAVVGVDNFAFLNLDNVTNFVLPASLKTDYIGNVAFLTKNSIVDFINTEIGEDKINDEATVLNYVAAAVNYNGKDADFTEAELAEVKAKLQVKAQLAGVVDGDNIYVAAEKMLINNADMQLSETTQAKFDLFTSGITYSNVMIDAPEGSDAAKYVDALEVLGVNFVLGDANGDLKLNVRDCAFIANALANGKGDTLPAAADYNKDDKKNVRDAANIANFLANSGIKE